MNSRRFLDSYTTVENSPKTQKENAKLHVMAMIKREILTIREVLQALAYVISSCFAKKCFPNYGN